MLDNAGGKAVVRLVKAMPRPVVWRLTKRYVAGPDLGHAIAVIERVCREGATVTVDILGEGVVTRERASATREEYIRALSRLQQGGHRGGVSVKLSALGLDLGREFCRENLETIVTHAAVLDRFVRIDMEQSNYTDRTLDMVMDTHSRHANVGAVIQACLYRSPVDVQRLAEASISIRVCKGIYRESAAAAHQDFEAVRRSFLGLVAQILEAGCYPAIATHDRLLVNEAQRMVAGLPPDAYEFQMLQGVATKLRRQLTERGCRVRVYVPYGQDWYAYGLRRLDENPRIASLMARALVGL